MKCVVPSLDVSVGEVLTALTLDVAKNYQQVWMTSSRPHQSTVVFSIVACQSAYVALLQIPGFTLGRTLEIGLGVRDNGWIEIRDGVDGSVKSEMG